MAKLTSIDPITTSKTQESHSTIGLHVPETGKMKKARFARERALADTFELVEIFASQDIDLNRESVTGINGATKEQEQLPIFKKCHLLPKELASIRAKESRLFESWVIASIDNKDHHVTVPANTGDRNKISVKIPYTFGDTKMWLYYAVATIGKPVPVTEWRATKRQLERNVRAFGALKKHGVKIQQVVYEYTIWERLDFPIWEDGTTPRFYFHIHANIIYTMCPKDRDGDFFKAASAAFDGKVWQDTGEVKEPAKAINYIFKGQKNDDDKKTILSDKDENANRQQTDYNDDDEDEDDDEFTVVELSDDDEDDDDTKVEILPPEEEISPQKAIHDFCDGNPNIHDFGDVTFTSESDPTEVDLPELMKPGTGSRAVVKAPWEDDEDDKGVVWDENGRRRLVTPLEMGRICPKTLAELYRQTKGVTLVKSDNEFAKYKKFLAAFSIKVMERNSDGVRRLFFQQITRKSLSDVDEQAAKEAAEKERNRRLKEELKLLMIHTRREENEKAAVKIKAIRKEAALKSIDIKRDYDNGRAEILNKAGVKRIGDLTPSQRDEYDRFNDQIAERREQKEAEKNNGIKAAKEAAKNAIADRKQAFLKLREKRLAEQKEEEFKQQCLDNGEKYLTPEERKQKEERNSKMTDYGYNRYGWRFVTYDYKNQIMTTVHAILNYNDNEEEIEEGTPEYLRLRECLRRIEETVICARENGFDEKNRIGTGIVGEYSIHYLQALVNGFVQYSKFFGVEAIMDWMMRQIGLYQKLSFVESDARFLPRAKTDWPDKYVNRLIKLVAEKYGDLLAREVSSAAALWFTYSKNTKKYLKSTMFAENREKLSIKHWLDDYDHRETIRSIDDDEFPAQERRNSKGWRIKPLPKSIIDQNVYPAAYGTDRQHYIPDELTDLGERDALHWEFEKGRIPIVVWYDSLWCNTIDASSTVEGKLNAAKRISDPELRQSEIDQIMSDVAKREAEEKSILDRLFGNADPIASGDLPPPPVNWADPAFIDDGWIDEMMNNISALINPAPEPEDDLILDW